MKSMRMAGIHPESIDAVLLTHGHFDHVLGLRNHQGKRAFRNAHVYVSKNEHRFWSSPGNGTQTAPQFLGMFMLCCVFACYYYMCYFCLGF